MSEVCSEMVKASGVSFATIFPSLMVTVSASAGGLSISLVPQSKPPGNLCLTCRASSKPSLFEATEILELLPSNYLDLY